jgi:hypothetical protein
MIFGYFTLFVALVIETVGAYYSVTGLAAIFSGALIPILIMGGSLEVGKVTAAVWLKLNWDRASIAYKLYLVPAVAFLMVLTSMGIFGFLSKAHSDQSLVSGDSMAKVAIYDEKIKTAKDNIDANRKALKQMDEAVDQVMGRSADEKGADKAVAIRRGQAKERTRLLSEITAEQKTIAQLSEERAPYAAEFRKVESEVGPIKYIAALLYGDNPDANILERAVRWVIILIVAVFDPLALVLILAAQQSLRWAQEEKDEHTPGEVNKHTQPSGSGLTIDEQIEAAEAASGGSGKSGQKPVDEPQTMLDRYPYLTKPFVHFKNLIPMVWRPEKTEHTIMEDTAAMAIIPPEKAEAIKQEIDAGFVYQPDVPKPITDFPELQAAIKQGLEDGSIVIQGAVEPAIEPEVSTQQPEPKILAMGVDVVDRPGDYVTPPEPEVTFLPDSDHLVYEGKSYSIDAFKDHFPELSAIADNHPSLGNAARADFGTAFPLKPTKGDLYLRTDYLPSKQFKWNGTKWIEVDKNITDALAYNEQYIQHLVEKLSTGEYDLDDLTDAEQSQVAEYLKNSAK